MMRFNVLYAAPTALVLLMLASTTASAVCRLEQLYGLALGQTRETNDSMAAGDVCTSSWGIPTGQGGNLALHRFMGNFMQIRVLEKPKEATIVTRAYEIAFRFARPGVYRIVYEVDIDDFRRTGVVRHVMNITVTP